MSTEPQPPSPQPEDAPISVPTPPPAPTPATTAWAQPAVSPTTVNVYERGPSLLIRFLWWLFIGWWASGLAVGIAWVALVTIIGIPLGIWIINRIPTILTLRPRTRHWSLGQDETGNSVMTEVGRPQVSWPIRGIWFVLVGWWASALWMGLAWIIQLTVVGIPIALLMFNRTPFIASLYRY